MPFTYCLRKLWPLHRGWKCMAALLACLCLLPDMAAHAQSPPRKVVVNGRVADESGDPVAGATIVERGTSNGVATLSEGEFSIAVDEYEDADYEQGDADDKQQPPIAHGAFRIFDQG